MEEEEDVEEEELVEEGGLVMDVEDEDEWQQDEEGD